MTCHYVTTSDAPTFEENTRFPDVVADSETCSQPRWEIVTFSL